MKSPVCSLQLTKTLVNIQLHSLPVWENSYSLIESNKLDKIFWQSCAPCMFIKECSAYRYFWDLVFMLLVLTWVVMWYFLFVIIQQLSDHISWLTYQQAFIFLFWCMLIFATCPFYTYICFFFLNLMSILGKSLLWMIPVFLSNEIANFFLPIFTHINQHNHFSASWTYDYMNVHILCAKKTSDFFICILSRWFSNYIPETRRKNSV